MKGIHTHECPECFKAVPCIDPAECAKNNTRDVVLLCETCARKKMK